MSRPISDKPASTGRGIRSHQITVTLSPSEAAAVERLRIREAARSWSEAIRLLIIRSERKGR